MKTEMMYQIIRQYLLAKFPLRQELTLQAVMNYAFKKGLLGKQHELCELVTLSDCCHNKLEKVRLCGCYFYRQAGKGLVSDRFMGKNVQYYSHLFEDTVNYLDENGYIILTFKGCQVMSKMVYEEENASPSYFIPDQCK